MAQPESNAQINDMGTETEGYDRAIIPAETAARKDREQDAFKQVPEKEGDESSIDTSGGFTVDKEGLLNNYAIEPEMYYEVPGDARDSTD